MSDRLGVDERHKVVSQLPEKISDSFRRAIKFCPKGTLFMFMFIIYDLTKLSSNCIFYHMIYESQCKCFL